MKKLPIGLNSLKNIIRDGFLYVDKTKKIYELIESGRYFFLSRPRRFGKTLTVDTLKNIFEGNRELFKGLYIYDKWDWEKKYPVIRIDMSQIVSRNTSLLENSLNGYLKEIASQFEIEIQNKFFGDMFRELIVKAHKKYKMPVVVLIDEYDKPILDNIEEPELAEEIRDLLSNFYGILKGLDENLRFVLLTGVTKFSKVNLFSKLNNLFDITVNEQFSDLCGYTEEELDIYFKEHLKGADRESIRRWYNGYSWLGERVYNPFDILLFIANNFQFRPYWFETGTPTFLLKLITRNRYFLPDLENVVNSDLMLGSFDVNNIEIETLMWQTGYLTIKEGFQTPRGMRYKLKIPNKEVEISLFDVIGNYLSKIHRSAELVDNMYGALISKDMKQLEMELKSLFASIPYYNFTGEKLYNYEGYYVSVFYAYIKALGVDLIAEDVTNRGRIDITLEFEDVIYIIEFKEDGKGALNQIRERKYYEKYLNRGKKIILLGIEFDKNERNIKSVNWEKLDLN